MPAQTFRASAAPRALCATLILAGACALDASVLGPEPTDDGAILAPLAFPTPECEAARPAALAVWEMTGVDPLCVRSEAELPLLWRDHFADGLGADCGCLADAGDLGAIR